MIVRRKRDNPQTIINAGRLYNDTINGVHAEQLNYQNGLYSTLTDIGRPVACYADDGINLVYDNTGMTAHFGAFSIGTFYSGSTGRLITPRACFIDETKQYSGVELIVPVSLEYYLQQLTSTGPDVWTTIETHTITTMYLGLVQIKNKYGANNTTPISGTFIESADSGPFLCLYFYGRGWIYDGTTFTIDDMWYITRLTASPQMVMDKAISLAFGGYRALSPSNSLPTGFKRLTNHATLYDGHFIDRDGVTRKEYTGFSCANVIRVPEVVGYSLGYRDYRYEMASFTSGPNSVVTKVFFSGHARRRDAVGAEVSGQLSFWVKRSSDGSAALHAANPITVEFYLDESLAGTLNNTTPNVIINSTSGQRLQYKVNGGPLLDPVLLTNSYDKVIYDDIIPSNDWEVWKYYATGIEIRCVGTYTDNSGRLTEFTIGTLNAVAKNPVIARTAATTYLDPVDNFMCYQCNTFMVLGPSTLAISSPAFGITVTVSSPYGTHIATWLAPTIMVPVVAGDELTYSVTIAREVLGTYITEELAVYGFRSGGLNALYPTFTTHSASPTLQGTETVDLPAANGFPAMTVSLLGGGWTIPGVGTRTLSVGMSPSGRKVLFLRDIEEGTLDTHFVTMYTESTDITSWIKTLGDLPLLTVHA